MKRLLYTCGVDQENPDDWPALADRLRRAVAQACGPDVEVEVGGEPVFTYGIDVEETLLALEDTWLGPRVVRIDLWCAIVGYGAVSIGLGNGLVRKERRGVEKGLRKVLRGECLVHEEDDDGFVRDTGRVYGYRLDPTDDRDRVTFGDLTRVFDPPSYVGERWLLQEDDESIDQEKFHLFSPASGRYVHFAAQDEEAEERAWRRAGSGEGLIVLYDDDSSLAEITRGFADWRNDLRRLAGKIWSPRVTLGRCRPDDFLVVTYDRGGPPVEEARLVFVI